MFAFISDVHLGIKSSSGHDLPYMYWQACLKKIRELGIKDVVLAGDIFNIPRLTPDLVSQFIDGARDLLFYAISGQHDATDQWVGALGCGKSLHDQVIILENQVAIGGFNHTYELSNEDLKGLLSRLKKSKAKYKILVLHQFFPELVGFSDVDDVSLDGLLKNVHFVISGNYHDIIKKDGVFYLGSFLNYSQNSRLFVGKADGSFAFVNIDYPTLADEDEEPCANKIFKLHVSPDELAEIKERYKGCIYQIILQSRSQGDEVSHKMIDFKNSDLVNLDIEKLLQPFELDFKSQSFVVKLIQAVRSEEDPKPIIEEFCEELQNENS